MTDNNLCMAVDCLALADKICECLDKEEGVDRIETIRLCNDHFLRQKALDCHRKAGQ